MSLADGPRALASAHISEPKLWSPDSPHLYGVRIELHGPDGLDRRGRQLFRNSLDCRAGWQGSAQW